MIYLLTGLLIVFLIVAFIAGVSNVAESKAEVRKKEFATTKKQLAVARNTLTGIASDRFGNPIFEAQDALNIIDELEIKELN